jgi:hypothetical protein
LLVPRNIDQRDDEDIDIETAERGKGEKEVCEEGSAWAARNSMTGMLNGSGDILVFLSNAVPKLRRGIGANEI